ncbi:hypothetical protein [Jongsikchunia kroppenstedtii]|uniref:hypothetical protein n=1 Tax=Jongsikchunia kroppenstedtii TaxID=1121721 RepID=UPI00035E1A7B|nr:hypothetical protein [Jongsikchunia kroppenstedtii]
MTNEPDTNEPDTPATDGPAADDQVTQQVPAAETSAKPAAETSAEPAAETSAKPVDAKPAKAAKSEKRSVTIPLDKLRWGAAAVIVIAALVAGLVVFAVRDMQARDDLSSLRTDLANRAKAEDIAGKYAVSAATLDYHDLTGWIAALKKGVSPELVKKYDVVGQSMQQVLDVLQVQTTASLVVSKTVNVADNIYNVQVVVETATKNAQMPQGSSSNVAYSITLDKKQNWLITQVGDPSNLVNSTLPGLGQPGAPQNGAQSGAPAPTAPAPTPAPGG